MQRLFARCFATLGLSLALALPAAADVTRLEIVSKAPYGTFQPGDYVLWKAKLHGELSPKEEIPDIDKAKTNARGMVEYTSDVVLLMPANPSKGNGALIVDVPNRGRVYGVALYNSPRDEPFESGTLAQGTGFLEDRGFALAEDHLRVWQPATGHILARGPVLTWASRSRSRQLSSRGFAALARHGLRSLKVARLAVHPGDTTVPALISSITATTRALAAGRHIGRYADLLADVPQPVHGRL